MGNEMVAYCEKSRRKQQKCSGGHLLRDLDPYGDSRMQRPSRGFDSVVGTTFGEYKRLDPLTGTAFGGQKRSNGRLSNAITELLKRNFDEIDRSGFDSFVKRNNFDEIDRYGFDGFVRKRRSGASAPSSDARNPETGLMDDGLDRH
ncbi:orcokinin peptides type A-like [Ischnura elegans]|uniref:orcokinin peptides type A-like n=1 Tax=Ischnura elegans TaxID=197161 RepID=UPI001ED89947|nr:orcokinin peptides type A-like [Ischnura elegans]